MGPFFIRGYLSISLKILTAATLPSAIFFIAGVSWLKLKPDIKILKKTIKTLPAVYALPPFILGGQLLVP